MEKKKVKNKINGFDDRNIEKQWSNAIKRAKKRRKKYGPIDDGLDSYLKKCYEQRKNEY